MGCAAPADCREQQKWDSRRQSKESGKTAQRNCRWNHPEAGRVWTKKLPLGIPFWEVTHYPHIYLGWLYQPSLDCPKQFLIHSDPSSFWQRKCETNKQLFLEQDHFHTQCGHRRNSISFPQRTDLDPVLWVLGCTGPVLWVLGCTGHRMLAPVDWNNTPRPHLLYVVSSHSLVLSCLGHREMAGFGVPGSISNPSSPIFVLRDPEQVTHASWALVFPSTKWG